MARAGVFAAVLVAAVLVAAVLVAAVLLLQWASTKDWTCQVLDVYLRQSYGHAKFSTSILVNPIHILSFRRSGLLFTHRRTDRIMAMHNPQAFVASPRRCSECQVFTVRIACI